MNRIIFTILALLFFNSFHANSCTNLIVTKGASEDGSCYLVYTNDGEWLYRLNKTEASDHKPGDSLEFRSRSGARGKIAQIGHTNALLGFQMNEYQVAIGETTFTGRMELWNHSKFLEYWHLMRLALERASTAREAVKVMTSLAETYGYGAEGESFSIIDPNEAWLLEMVGTGDGNEGAIWVAVKIPDGKVCAHANMSRIGTFPLNDPENCMYASNVISFAIEKGYYNPDTDGPFRFNEVYNPVGPDRLKYCESRVWSLFNRMAPSLQLSTDYCRGVKGAERYPLWISPDKPLNLRQIFSLVRDHYEGTPFDMTKGIEAGPFGNPNRCRPLNYTIDDENYSWERPISTYNTAFSFVAQCRSYMPDNIGGLVWFGVDDTYTTCYTPMYACMTEIDNPFAVGSLQKFSWKSMFWVFNFVANFANIRYSNMIEDIQLLQGQLEDEFLAKQIAVEKTASGLKGKKRIKYLTQYSNSAANRVHEKWKELAENLVCKYNDGYIKNEKGQPQTVGYPEEWYREVNRIENKKFRIPNWKKDQTKDYKPF